MSITVDRPTPNTTENHDARLAQLNLKYGAATVYRDSKGIFWATGDYKFCAENIDHNIQQMISIMQAEGLRYIGKDYDSDIYKEKGRGKKWDWESLMHLNHGKLVSVNTPLPISVS